MNKPELHFMLDLETLDNKPSSYILELALVAFDPSTGEVNEALTTNAVFGACQGQPATTRSLETYEWWLKKNPQQLAAYFDNDRLVDQYVPTMCTVVSRLADLRATHKVNVWCTGTFDVDILNYHVDKLYGTQDLIRFYEVRDVRTMKQMCKDFGFAVADLVATHSAYEDCLRQIKYVSNIYEVLNGRLTKGVGDQGRCGDVSDKTEHSPIDRTN